jgi:glycosyltransferase involved in cell wall biosynthesis
MPQQSPKEQPYIPVSVFIGIAIEGSTLHACIHDGTSTKAGNAEIDPSHKDNEIASYLKTYEMEHDVKIVAAGMGEANKPEELAEKLWLDYDIVPYIARGTGESAEERAEHMAVQIANDYKRVQELDVAIVKPEEGGKMVPSFLTTFEPYKKGVPQQDLDYLMQETKRFRSLGGRVVFVNSTPQGGGVALMRHALMRLYRLLGVHATWYVMKPKVEVFEITKKKFHNMLQGVAPKGLVLTDEDKDMYRSWIEMNKEQFEEPFRKANVVVIDDYQPSGLIPFLKEVNPDVKIMYRSHIHIDTSLLEDPDSSQNVTWNFIWEHNRVKETDIFLSHPIEAFIPRVVPKEKIVLMPATTDPVDGLNKPLTKKQIAYYHKIFNVILAREGQKPLDTRRPYIIQIARFDPSKGIPDVLEAYRALRDRLKQEGRDMIETPQLIVAGHGAVDDPEGIPILEETRMILEVDRYKEFADDVKLARFPHNDQILNALLRGSTVALQLSHKEGLEVKVSESLHKGKPIIIYGAGGMPLQVVDNMNAFIVEKGQTHQVADHLYSLFTDKELYKRMSEHAAGKLNQDFFTVRNAYKWLFMANELLEKGHLAGNGRNINEIIEETYKN